MKFYKALGLEVVHADEYWASLKIGNLSLGLHDNEGTPIAKTPRDSHGQACGGTLTFLSNNINESKVVVYKTIFDIKTKAKTQGLDFYRGFFV